MEELRAPPSLFWELYFGNRFSMLTRGAARYVGVAAIGDASADGPAALLREPREGRIAIDLITLRDYDYSADPRFRLHDPGLDDPSLAFAKILDKSYPYRGGVPFGIDRMAELFAQVRNNLRALAIPTGEAALESMLMWLVDMDEPPTQQIVALSWWLGERGHRSSTGALLKVLRNSSYVPYARRVLPVSTAMAAFAALWKVNDKRVVPELFALMPHCESSGRRHIAALFERIGSREELRSQALLGDDYTDPAQWAPFVNACLEWPELDWQRFDAQSLFWEIRLSAALRLPLKERATLRQLAADEVETVRTTAARRLENELS